MIKIIMNYMFQLYTKVSGTNFIMKGLPFFQSMFLSIALQIYVNEYFELKVPIFIICIESLIIFSLIVGFAQSNHKLFISGIAIGSFCVSLLVMALLHIPVSEHINNLLEWCKTYNGTIELYHKWYSYIIMFLVIAIINVTIFLLHKIKVSKYVLSLICPLLLIISVIANVYIHKLTIMFVLFYAMFVLVEVLGKLSNKENSMLNHNLASMYLAPVYALIVVIAIILPSKSEPISWSAIKNLYLFMEEKASLFTDNLKYIVTKSGDEFRIAVSGYSDDDDNTLGGSLSTSEKINLYVKTRATTKGNGYLAGSIYDTYTGHSWTKSEDQQTHTNSDYEYDLALLLNSLAVAFDKGWDLDNMLIKRMNTIEYYNIRTKSLFYPLKTYQIIKDKKDNTKESTQGNILFDKPKGKGLAYEVYFYELNLKNEILKDIFRLEESGEIASIETLNKVAKSILKYNEWDASRYEDIFYELEDRRDSIYVKYTSLPSTVTERTKLLAYDLTKDLSTDYDKLKKLELFLGTFDYTTSAQKVPKDRDFVDYFLFEEQKGYCTYFASAMTVLARSIGIPTRYVEGFILDYKDSPENYVYVVKSSNAHAWAEAYIDGVGWIPFEPTPTYYSDRYKGWIDYSKQKETYNLDGLYDYEEELLESMESFHTSRGFDYEKVIVEDVKSNVFTRGIVITMGFILIFLLIVITYYKILEHKYRRKYLKGSQLTKLKILLAEIFKYFELDGYKRQDNETLYYFAKRIDDRVIFEEISLYEISNIYMRSRYGEEMVTGDEVDQLKRYAFRYRIYLNSKLGKKKMLLYRFIYLNSIRE